MKKRILFLSFILLSQAIPLSAMHHKKRFSRKTSLVKPSLITLVLLLTLTAPVNGTVEGNGVLRSQEEYWKKSAEESRKRLEDEIIRRRMADDEARRRTASNSNPFHGEAYGAAVGWMNADRNRIEQNGRNLNRNIDRWQHAYR